MYYSRHVPSIACCATGGFSNFPGDHAVRLALLAWCPVSSFLFSLSLFVLRQLSLLAWSCCAHVVDYDMHPTLLRPELDFIGVAYGHG